MNLSEMSIKRKIASGFGVLILLILIGGVYNFRSVTFIKDNQQEIAVSMEVLTKTVEDKKNIWEAQLIAQKWLTPVVEEKEALLLYILADEKNDLEMNEQYARLGKINKTLIRVGERLATMAKSEKIVDHVKNIKVLQENAFKMAINVITTFDEVETKEYGPSSRKDMLDFISYTAKLSFAIRGLQKKLQEEEIIVNERHDLALKSVHERVNVSISTISSTTFMSSLIIFFSIVFAVTVSVVVIISITRSIDKVVHMITDMSTGDFTTRLNLSRKDEIGVMAGALDDFGGKLADIIRDIRNYSQTLSDSSQQLYDVSGEMEKDADTMNSLAISVVGNSESMALNISEVVSAGDLATESVIHVSSSIKEMSDNMTNISYTTDQVTSNAHTVATSIEQMSSTVGEITKNTLQAANISEQASEKAKEAQVLMENLGESAISVGKVIEVIKNIADRTNLLALNATIEAASAGDAGKGFAVVASEVKDLAKKTTEATEEIVMQIEKMQESTHFAVDSISEIATTINEINLINSVIASAVEEQDATTNEVSRTTSQTVLSLEDVQNHLKNIANGAEEVAGSVDHLTVAVAKISKKATDTSTEAKEVSSNIHNVSLSVENNLAGSKRINKNAGELSKLSDSLKELVVRFKVKSK